MSIQMPLLSVLAIAMLFAAERSWSQESSEPRESLLVTEGDLEKTPSKFRDPVDGKFDISQMLLESLVGFMPIPLIITEPAVEDGLGLAGAFFHKPRDGQMEPGSENLIMPNISAVGAAYTGNESWFVGGAHLRNWSKDHYRYEVLGGYANVNLDWYGSAGLPTPGNGLRFNVEGAMLNQLFLMRVGESRWYVGPELRVMSSDVAFDLGLPVTLPPIENQVIGASVVALYENLDFRFSPRVGFKTELRATVNSDALGSDYNFEQYSWQLRHYFEFADRYFISWRLDGSSTHGDVPFYMEPFVQIEGIAAMRYQGPTAATLEVRGGVDITPRWSLLGFAGSGRAADTLGDLASATSRSAVGGGFRYLLARQLGLRVGIDIARGPEETYWYLIVGSAW